MTARCVSLICCVILAASFASFAAVPTLLSYEGRLTNLEGSPETASKDIVFEIWDASSGGSIVWGPEAHTVSPDDQGVFSVILGSTTAFTPAVFSSADRYLAITIDGEEIAPRTQIVSVGYAFRAAVADELAGGAVTAEAVVVPLSFSGTVNAGDVVVIDATAPNTVKTTTTAKDDNVMGFVSHISGTTAYVAISGRITNAVANGAINIGDSLTTSTTAGRVDGQTNIQSGRTIGIALTSAAGAGSTLSVMVYRF